MERHETSRRPRVQSDLAPFLVRISLGAGFLSAVADRFGVWGPAGTPSVSWGNYQNFVAYTAKLNPWSPAVMVPALAGIVTFAEAILGVLLILGLMTRMAALFSGMLTLIFALAMTAVLGIHAPLIYGVFVYSAASLFLAAITAPDKWTLDALIAKRGSHG
ncbi:DoxX family membrane protein [Alloacidobacterium dinghuense]|uniref:DoxX family membrane protein n=1 Tax=Alloacidobacterium dinghuense TaxID=2763107 RepID=A0A7G8BPB4_9BACT|nr:DoxX family membrane protein [Alloacidobacterium dinghuense]QNI34384.1 DoxX family membrane protein [Alloacidobacterium dinghuense]